MTEGHLLAAIGALALAVVTQWKIQYDIYKKLEIKVTACEKDRLDLWSKLAELQYNKSQHK